MTARILGLDLSITGTGIASADGTARTVDLRKHTGDGRLGIILGCVTDELEHGIDLAIVEDLPTHARAAGITGMVHGVVRWALIDAGVPYALITPATLKQYATGKGNADKTAMALAAYKRAGAEFGDDNQCDAWWLRQAGLHHLGTPELELPAAQVAALLKVRWPQATGAAA